MIKIIVLNIFKSKRYISSKKEIGENIKANLKQKMLDEKARKLL